MSEISRTKTGVVHKGSFDACHSIPGFGKCENKHGHTYTVDVCVWGDIGPDGVVMDFRELKGSYALLDHADLNEIMDEVPTAENIALWILDRILVYVEGNNDCKVNAIKIILYEGSHNMAIVEYEIK